MVYYIFLLCYVGMIWAAENAELAQDDQLYCTIRYRRLCQGKGRHVACQFPNQGPGEDCHNYTQVKFTSDLQHFITNYINRRRQKLAAGHERVRGGAPLPRPQTMMLVEWDRELAHLGQRLADQCYFVHDECRATVRYPYAGQTVGEVHLRRSSDTSSSSARRAIRRVLDAWWGERRRVDVKQLTQPFRITAKGTVWGHFSQLAVWSLTAVGCGAARHGEKHPSLLLVCDFSHTNMLGQRTINPGNLMPCPENTRRKPLSPFPLLCASIRSQHVKTTEDTEEYVYHYDDQPNVQHTTRRFTKYTDGEDRTNRKEPDERTTYITTTKTIKSIDYVAELPVTTASSGDLPLGPNSFYNKLALRLRPKIAEVKKDGDNKRPVKSGEVGKWRNLEVTSEQTETTEVRKGRTNRQPGGKLFQTKPWTRRRKHKKIINKLKNLGPQTANQDDETAHTETEFRISLSTSYMANSFRFVESYYERKFCEVIRSVKRVPVKQGETIKISSCHQELQKGRHKSQWKQMRAAARRKRPGATALLQIKPLALSDANVRLSTSAAFMMDEEDVMQLYRDTGFQSSRRKSKS